MHHPRKPQRLALSIVHSQNEEKRKREMEDQYSLKRHVMMMMIIIIIIIVMRKTLVSTKLPKANKKP